MYFMDNNCYNPYQGVKYIRDLKKKSIKENRKLQREYDRLMSIDPKNLLADAHAAIEEMLSPNFSLEGATNPTFLKGVGFLLTFVCLIMYLLTFLRQ